MKLDIISDPVCPWCYIGKANLDRALERVGDHPFEIEWHPFQLNPDMPVGGADRRTYLEAKFGGKAQAVAAYARVTEMGAAAGLVFNFEAVERAPNTLNAHRLIHWAGVEARQSQVVTALFRAYFTDGRDIGDAEVLADLADSAGMDGAVVARLLASDADVADIQARDRHSREMGVTSVPTFIVDHRHAVPGAQPVAMWDKVIADIRAQTAV